MASLVCDDAHEQLGETGSAEASVCEEQPCFLGLCLKLTEFWDSPCYPREICAKNINPARIFCCLLHTFPKFVSQKIIPSVARLRGGAEHKVTSGIAGIC